MKRLDLIMAFAVMLSITACGGGDTSKESTSSTPPPKSMVAEEADPMENKGLGPIKELKLEAVNEELAAEGLKIFGEMCSACHKPDKKFIGPSPKGIMERRSPEWVMNMILNPEEMIANDPIAKQLLIDSNMAQMANQNLTEDQARAVLEYFRTL